MLESDKNTIDFVNRFKKLQKDTLGFTNINSELFLKDQTCIEIFRVAIGVTINGLSKIIGIPYSWIYNLEKQNFGYRRYFYK